MRTRIICGQRTVTKPEYLPARWGDTIITHQAKPRDEDYHKTHSHTTTSRENITLHQVFCQLLNNIKVYIYKNSANSSVATHLFKIAQNIILLSLIR